VTAQSYGVHVPDLFLRTDAGYRVVDVKLDPMRLLTAATDTQLHAYVVLSLLTGARTEELRALTWDSLDLDSDPPTIQVWRSIRRGGEMKTTQSRRTLELPNICARALRDHLARIVHDAGA
jgi:integrase